MGYKELTIGIYTDSVQKVPTIKPDDIESTPKIGIQINIEFIHECKLNDEFVNCLILINI